MTVSCSLSVHAMNVLRPSRLLITSQNLLVRLARRRLRHISYLCHDLASCMVFRGWAQKLRVVFHDMTSSWPPPVRVKFPVL
jgi:hypothetical protein